MCRKALKFEEKKTIEFEERKCSSLKMTLEINEKRYKLEKMLEIKKKIRI